MLEKFPTTAHLLEAYNTDLISKMSATEDCLRRVYFGGSPSLAMVRELYGLEAVVSWIEILFEHVQTYCGASNRMPVEVLREFAHILVGQYYYLSMAEVVLFVSRIESGRYGRFYYSTPSPVDIGNFLQKFCAERVHEIAYIERVRRSPPAPQKSQSTS